MNTSRPRAHDNADAPILPNVPEGPRLRSASPARGAVDSVTPGSPIASSHQLPGAVSIEVAEPDRPDSRATATDTERLLGYSASPRSPRPQRAWEFVTESKSRAAAASLLLFLSVGFIYVAIESRKAITAPFPTPKERPITILVSLDGFRSEYLDRGLTPTIASLIEGGIRAKYLEPSFPTITFPNHFTLVTGRLPSEHGIISNTFYDPNINETFTYTNPKVNGDARFWAGAEPIWITATKNGIRTATSAWPGSTVPYGGHGPDKTVDATLQALWVHYRNWTVEQRVSLAVRLMDLPPNPPEDIAHIVIPNPDPKFEPPPLDDDANPAFGGIHVNGSFARPEFLAVYIPDVDQIGHKHGPGSVELNQTLTRVDTQLGMLIKHLQNLTLWENTNFVIVSDHGMTRAVKSISLPDVLGQEWANKVIVRDRWPILMLEPFDQKDTGPLFKHLEEKSEAGFQFKPYMRGQLPEHLHYGNNPRIPPIVAIPDLGYQFRENSTEDIPIGMHGYDLEGNPDMRAIFIGHGPYFSGKRRGVVPAFSNVEVYNILCKVMDMPPAPNSAAGLPWLE